MEENGVYEKIFRTQIAKKSAQKRKEKCEKIPKITFLNKKVYFSF